MAKLHRILFLLFISFISDLAAAEEHTDPTEFSTNSELTCARIRLTIRTYCERSQYGEPFCFLQKFSFHDLNTNEEKNVFFLYENKRSSQSLAERAACVKAGEKYLVIVGGTKLGSARRGCEWFDAYGQRGDLLGTSGTPFGPSNRQSPRINPLFFQKFGLDPEDGLACKWKNEVSGVKIPREIATNLRDN